MLRAFEPPMRRHMNSQAVFGFRVEGFRGLQDAPRWQVCALSAAALAKPWRFRARPRNANPAENPEPHDQKGTSPTAAHRSFVFAFFVISSYGLGFQPTSPEPPMTLNPMTLNRMQLLETKKPKCLRPRPREA